jgi:predicted peptidase
MKFYRHHIAIVFSCSVLITCCKKETKDIGIIETRPPELKANTVAVNDIIGGFYSAVPEHYNETTINYPLILFLHGLGQIGNGSADLHSLTYGGIPRLLKDGRFPATFTVKGKHFSFIILAPQFKWWPDVYNVRSFVDYAIKNYRIDSTRMYVSGLSFGGILSTEFAAEFPSLLAAIVPIAGVSSGYRMNETCEKIARANLPLWVFQNDKDDLFNVENAKKFIIQLNSFHPGIPPRYSEFLPFGLEGHDAWTKATDPDYKENNMNIYEWMLQYSK